MIQARDFLYACLPYFHEEEGVMTLTNPPETTDNNFLFTATMLHIARRLDAFWFENAVAGKLNSAFTKALNRQRIEPGLFQPWKSWGDMQNLSHDEILGLATAHIDIAREVARYGKKHFWVFDNLGQPGIPMRQWMGRFPTLVHYIKSRAMTPDWNPVNYIYATLEFSLTDRTTPPGTTSGRCRRYLMAYWFYERSSGPLQWAAKKYLRRLQETYGDVAGLYQIYFGVNHPFTQFTKGISFL